MKYPGKALVLAYTKHKELAHLAHAATREPRAVSWSVARKASQSDPIRSVNPQTAPVGPSAGTIPLGCALKPRSQPTRQAHVCASCIRRQPQVLVCNRPSSTARCQVQLKLPCRAPSGNYWQMGQRTPQRCVRLEDEPVLRVHPFPRYNFLFRLKRQPKGRRPTVSRRGRNPLDAPVAVELIVSNGTVSMERTRQKKSIERGQPHDRHKESEDQAHGGANLPYPQCLHWRLSSWPRAAFANKDLPLPSMQILAATFIHKPSLHETSPPPLSVGWFQRPPFRAPCRTRSIETADHIARIRRKCARSLRIAPSYSSDEKVRRRRRHFPTRRQDKRADRPSD